VCGVWFKRCVVKALKCAVSISCVVPMPKNPDLIYYHQPISEPPASHLMRNYKFCDLLSLSIFKIGYSKIFPLTRIELEPGIRALQNYFRS
jgi:hypothetical protein